MSALAIRALFPLLALAMLLPQASGPIALGAGLLFAIVLGNPYLAETKRWTPLLLQASIIGLGAGMDLNVIGRVGAEGILYTAVGIIGTLALGQLIGRWLRTDPEVSALLGVGTAICGGSAIAALSPMIRAKDQSISVSLATVFLLNAFALLLFPYLGHWSGMGQRQFGLFSALAIHDTSSVIGSAMQYGAEALTVATTVKLARALWIVPVAMGYAFLWSRTQDKAALGRAGAIKKPWFILGFLMMATLVTWAPGLAGTGAWIALIAKRGLTLTLFLIGAGLTRATLRSVGVRPFIHGMLLWIAVIAGTWSAIEAGWIR